MNGGGVATDSSRRPTFGELEAILMRTRARLQAGEMPEIGVTKDLADAVAEALVGLAQVRREPKLSRIWEGDR